MRFRYKLIGGLVVLAVLGYIAINADLLTKLGLGAKPAGGPPPVAVKVMQVLQRDTTVTYEYVGQVEAKNEVQIRTRVSGNLVAKMVEGGATVSEGQPLFQIDRRQYESALLAAQAQLGQSEATLANSRLDTMRYKKLAQNNAISQQALDTAVSVEQQNLSVAEANRARMQQARDDLKDTTIVAPFSGRVDINDLSVGSFVQSGTTVLATVSSVNPIRVRFSMSENEYLLFSKLGRGVSPEEWGKDLTLILSDGSRYPLVGRIEQVDRGLTQDTGTLTMKATFDNPQKILMPGMFARIQAPGELRQGALLIPQRAVQQLLGKNFVTIVAEGEKAEPRPVKMGPRVGNLWVVEEGLAASDRIVVEGFLKTPPGTPLQISMIRLEDLQTTTAKD